MSDAPDPKALDDLDTRIRAAQAAREPEARRANEYEKASVAWRMVTELVVGMAMGVGLGYWLDSLFGTLPIFLILFSLFGFAAGIRVMMRTANEVQEHKVASAAKDETAR